MFGSFIDVGKIRGFDNKKMTIMKINQNLEVANVSVCIAEVDKEL